MKKQRKADPLWTPKIPEVKSICETCPFNASGEGHAVRHPDYPNLVKHAEMIGDFPCHQTTTLKKGRDPQRLGEPGQRQCKGAADYRRGTLALPDSVIDFWRPLGFVEEDTPLETKDGGPDDARAHRMDRAKQTLDQYLGKQPPLKKAPRKRARK